MKGSAWQDVWAALQPGALCYWTLTTSRDGFDQAHAALLDAHSTAVAVSGTEFQVCSGASVLTMRAADGGAAREWLHCLQHRHDLLSDNRLIEKAEYAMSRAASVSAGRDRRLMVWLDDLEEVLHTAVFRDTFLAFTQREYSSENLLFWMHACAYELAHPLTFTPTPWEKLTAPGNHTLAAMSASPSGGRACVCLCLCVCV